MDTLRLVEVAPDGALVLMTGDGRRFSLAVDEQLRSAVRRSRHGTHDQPLPDRASPREVQARIRAGADAEQVAAQTGLDVDFVRRFEGPVLAERAHVADLARATAVDRGGDPTLTLERVVLEVLTGEGFDVDDVAWDSRRSDGTRWEVLAVSSDGPVRTEATWSFDTSTRALEPVDAEAERLTGVERRRRLSAVRDTVFDVERPAASAVRGGTVELLDALARQRGRRPAPVRGAGDGPAVGERDHEPPTGGSPREAAGPPDEDDADHGADPSVGPAVGAAVGTVVGAAVDVAVDVAVDAVRAVAARDDADEPAARTEATRPTDDDATPTGSTPAGQAPATATPAGPTPPTVRRSRLPADADGLRVVGDGRAGPTATGREDGRDDGQTQLSIEPDLLSQLDLDHLDRSRTSPARVPSAASGAAPSPGPVSSPRPAEPAAARPANRGPAEPAGDRRSSRRRRAAVPSWDEIVFGAKREDG